MRYLDASDPSERKTKKKGRLPNEDVRPLDVQASPRRAMRHPDASGPPRRTRTKKNVAIELYIVALSTRKPFKGCEQNPPMVDRSNRCVYIRSTSMLESAEYVSIVAVHDCARNPCVPRQRCSYSNYSLLCTPCPTTTVGLDGIVCTLCTCMPRRDPNAGNTRCVSCIGNSASFFGL